MRPGPYTLTRLFLLAWFAGVAGACPCRAAPTGGGQRAAHACCHSRRPVDRPAPNCVHCGTADRVATVTPHAALSPPAAAFAVVDRVATVAPAEPSRTVPTRPPPWPVPLRSCTRLL